MSRVLGFWFALLLIFSGGMLIWMLQKQNRANERTVPTASSNAIPSGPKMTEFELIDQTGQRVNSNDLKGKIWTGSFFFCSCPSTCYNQNLKLAEIQSRFASQGLMSVSITCDPANDTPAVLSNYASRFNADARTWKFVTPADADMNYIQRIGNDFFGVMVGEETHTDRVMVVDQTGKIRGSFSVLQPEQFKNLQDLVTELLENNAAGQAAAPATPAGDTSPESESQATEPDPAANDATSAAPVSSQNGEASVAITN